MIAVTLGCLALGESAVARDHWGLLGCKPSAPVAGNYQAYTPPPAPFRWGHFGAQGFPQPARWGHSYYGELTRTNRSRQY